MCGGSYFLLISDVTDVILDKLEDKNGDDTIFTMVWWDEMR